MNENKLKKQAHLAAYDLLKSTASWLDNPDNEVYALLEFDEDSLSITAKACTLASAILQKAALDLQVISGIEDTNKYSFNMEDVLDGLNSLASEFEVSNNPDLVKKANLLEDILLTISSSVEEQNKFKQAVQKKIEDIKKKSKQANSVIKVESTESKASIDDTEKGKELRPLQAPLSTRNCPDHPGVMLVRISDGLFYCPLNGKQYDFNSGYTTEKGNKVPGTSVKNQNEDLDDFSMPTMFFDK